MADHTSTAKLEPESQGFLKAILDTAVDAIIAINASGIIQSINPAAVRMFGYQISETVGKNVNMLMPNPWRDQHDAYLQRYLKTGEARIIGIGRQVTGRKKDGRTFPLDLAVSEVTQAGERFFVGIMRDMTQQRFTEQALVNAIENERREIGRDLHDALGQIITGISLLSKSLAKKLSTHDAALADDAQTIATMCAGAATEAKRLAYGSFPTELERQGLQSALEQLLYDVRKVHHIETHFICERRAKGMPSATELHLYRIAQESLANAVKHGRPRNIWLKLVEDNEGTSLEIRDDGTGIKSPPESGAISMGLHIMRHRASLIGGEFQIRPGRNGGTEVLCCIRSPFPVSNNDQLES